MSDGQSGSEPEDHQAQAGQPGLTDRLQAIREALRALEIDGSDEDARDSLRRALHQLRGSAATLGFALAGDIAEEMHALLQRSSSLLRADLDRMAEGAQQIEAIVSEPARDSGALRRRFTILVADRGTGLGRGIERLARQRAWDLEIVADHATVPDRLRAGDFDAVVLMGDDDERWAPAEIEPLTGPKTPPVVVVQPAETQDRVAQARAGVSHSLGTASMHDIGHLLDEILPARRADRGKIVLIDDDAVFRGALLTVLRPLGWYVTAIGDASQAFETLRAENPDLIIADMEMPGVGGIDLVRAVRTAEEFHGVPIVMVTAHNDPDKWLAGFQAGADVVIDKAGGATSFRRALLTALRRLEPRERQRSSAARHRVSLEAGTVSSLGDVVLVEDDETLREMLEYALRNEGYICTTYSNGQKALDELMQADTGGAHPVVVLDVDLPGVDGFTLLQELEQARPGRFQIVITTVHNSEREQVKALRSGAADYMVKPVSVPVMLAKIERLLTREVTA